MLNEQEAARRVIEFLEHSGYPLIEEGIRTVLSSGSSAEIFAFVDDLANAIKLQEGD